MCLTKFELYLSRLNLKANTVKQITYSIRKALKVGVLRSKSDADKIILNLRSANCKLSYLNNIVTAIRHFARFSGIKDLEKYPFFPTNSRTIRTTMSDKEIEEFLALPRPHIRGLKQVDWDRWTMFFKIMSYCGCRSLEVSKLCSQDVDFGRQTITFRDTKTHDDRLVPIPPTLQKDLKEFLEKSGPKPFFVANTSAYSHNFRKRLELMGLKREGLTCYSLRHSYISRMLDEDGVNVFQVQRQCGHKRLETTSRYYHSSVASLVKMGRHDPLARKAVDPAFLLRQLVETIKSFNFDQDRRFDYTFVEQPGKVRLDLSVK